VETMGLIRGHATGVVVPSKFGVVIKYRVIQAPSPRPALRRGTVLLAELAHSRESMGATELRPLAKLVHTLLTGMLMLLGVHLHIVLRYASRRVDLEERAVASIENVHLRVSELRIAEIVDRTILMANEFGPGQNQYVFQQVSWCMQCLHDGCPVRRVLAMEDEEGVGRRCRGEKLLDERFLVIMVDGAIYMTTFVLIFETAVNHADVVIEMVELTIQHINQCLLFNPGKAIRLIITDEMGQLKGMGVIHVHDRLESTRSIVRGFLLHYVLGMLKHTQRPAELLTWACAMSNGLPCLRLTRRSIATE
jgi:hypothetical protein